MFVRGSEKEHWPGRAGVESGERRQTQRTEL